MKYKLMLWISVFLLNLNIALAQTGLFNADAGQDFALFGILAIVIILIIRSIVKGKFRIRTF